MDGQRRVPDPRRAGRRLPRATAHLLAQPRTRAEVIADNLAALRLLRDLHTPNPTDPPDLAEPADPGDRALEHPQLETLARFRSWGATGVAEVFDERDGRTGRHASTRAELDSLLDPDAFRAARRTIINAHYTHPAFVEVAWHLAHQLGVPDDTTPATGQTGHNTASSTASSTGDVAGLGRPVRVLEPGCGTGTFLTLGPANHIQVGVELDPSTARIAELLNPGAAVVNASFTEIPLPRLRALAGGKFDLVIGNVPFGNAKPHDPRLNPSGEHSLHNYFLLKSLHLTAPGGLVIALTSRYTMDAANPASRLAMAELGDFLGAIRLPSHAHQTLAGTAAITDLVILRRRPAGHDMTDLTRTVFLAPTVELPVPDGTHNTLSTDGKDHSADSHRLGRHSPDGHSPDDLGDAKAESGGGVVRVARYFADRPGNVLGAMTIGHSLYGRDLVVQPADVGDSVVDQIAGHLRQRASALAAETPTGLRWNVTPDLPPDTSDPANTAGMGGVDVGRVAQAPEVGQQDGYLTEATGAGASFVSGFGVVEDGALVELPVPAAQRAELRQLLGLRDQVVGLLQAEAATLDSTAEMEQLRGDLNRGYDAYLRRFGPVNRYSTVMTSRVDASTGEAVVQRRVPPVMRTFRQDPYAPVVFALEDFDESTQHPTKSQIFHDRVVVRRQPRRGADTPAEAVAICEDTHGEIRLDVIAQLLGVADHEVAAACAGVVFYDPSQQTWVSRAEYLSGDVRTKLRTVRTALAETATAPIAEETATGPTTELVTGGDISQPIPAPVRDSIPAPDSIPGSGSGSVSGSVVRSLGEGMEALRGVQPATLGPSEISVQLGAAWVPADDVRAFLSSMLNDRSVQVLHAGGSQWEVKGRSWGIDATSTYGTDRMDAVAIARCLLKQSPIQVFDDLDGPDGRTRSVLNPTDTLAAQEKGAVLNEAFEEWIWADPARANRLCTTYNDRFNAIVLRHYDGEHLTLPGLAASFAPRPHQRAAVARMLAEPAVGLFHEVGAGKTAEMVMGCMELRRLGLVGKPAIVVPNHMLEQFTREFLQLYPQARLLAASSADLAGDKRRRFIGRAATGDWDAVILTRGSFERLEVTNDTIQAYLNVEMDLLRGRLEAYTGSGMSSKRVEAAIARAEERAKKRLDVDRDPGVTFEQTGIDYLCVDELHDYKNLTTPSNLPGAAIDGSNRATDLHMKLHYLRTTYGRRVVTAATATPIANSMTEAYVTQRYLRPDLLAAAGLTDFDSWAATFGRVVTGLEYTPAGALKMKTRFAKFVNVPELLRLWHVAGDVKTAEDLDLPVPQLRTQPDGTRAGEVVVVARTDAQTAYMTRLGQRADQVKAMGAQGEDNILVITTDGRKAALDLRLLSDTERHWLHTAGHPIPGTTLGEAIGPWASTDPPLGQIDDLEATKLDAAANRITAIWEQTRTATFTGPDGEESPQRGALQLVFCDLGTPAPPPRMSVPHVGLPSGPDSAPSASEGSSRRFSVYDTLKQRLVDAGIPAGQVRFIHDAKNDADKARLFAACRSGQVAVLIGSTSKMGVGTNIQARAVALHHLDCPWRPADIAQRDGRILRQGNQNAEVEVIRYVTERSFDAALWGMIARKASFIGQVMKGRLDVREIDDIGDVALDASQVAAAVSGDNRILLKAQLETDVNRLQRLHRAHGRNQRMLIDQVAQLGHRLTITDQVARTADTISRRYQPTVGDDFHCTIAGTRYGKRTDAETALRHLLTRWHSSGRADTTGSADIASSSSAPISIGGIRFDLQAVRDPTPDTWFGARITPAGLRDAPTLSVSANTPIHQLDRPGVLNGVLQRLENSASRIAAVGAEARSIHRDLLDQRQRATEQLGQPFKHTAELTAKTNDIQHLNAELTAEIATTSTATSRGTDTDLDANPSSDPSINVSSDASTAASLRDRAFSPRSPVAAPPRFPPADRLREETGRASTVRERGPNEPPPAGGHER